MISGDEWGGGGVGGGGGLLIHLAEGAVCARTGSAFHIDNAVLLI